jgi:hypothetical protein
VLGGVVMTVSSELLSEHEGYCDIHLPTKGSYVNQLKVHKILNYSQQMAIREAQKK